MSAGIFHYPPRILKRSFERLYWSIITALEIENNCIIIRRGDKCMLLYNQISDMLYLSICSISVRLFQNCVAKTSNASAKRLNSALHHGYRKHTDMFRNAINCDTNRTNRWHKSACVIVTLVHNKARNSRFFNILIFPLDTVWKRHSLTACNLSRHKSVYPYNKLYNNYILRSTLLSNVILLSKVLRNT